MKLFQKLFHKEERRTMEEEKEKAEEQATDKTPEPEESAPGQPEPQQEPEGKPEEPAAEEPGKPDALLEAILNMGNKLDKLVTLMEAQSGPKEPQEGVKGLAPNDPNRAAGTNEPKPYLDRYRG